MKNEVYAIFLEEHEKYYTKKGFRKWNKEKRKQLFNGECSYCKTVPERLTLDHFIPRSESGRHHYDNLIPACEYCNGKKGSENAYEWYKKQTFYDPKRWQSIIEVIGEQEKNKVEDYSE